MSRIFLSAVVDALAAGLGVFGGVLMARLAGRPARAWKSLSFSGAGILLLVFNAIAGSLPGLVLQWSVAIQRWWEPVTWASATVLLAFGLAWAVRSRVPSVVLSLALALAHAGLCWPIAALLRDVRQDGVAIPSRSFGAV
jgi:hypothetical protein